MEKDRSMQDSMMSALSIEERRALGAGYSKKAVSVIFRKKTISNFDALCLFSMADYCLDTMGSLFPPKFGSQRKYQQKMKVRKFIERNGLTDEFFQILLEDRHDKERSKIDKKLKKDPLSHDATDIEKGRTKLEGIIDDMSDELQKTSDVYHIDSDDFRARLTKVDDDDFSTTSIIKQYKKVFKALMLRATGEAIETERAIQYIVQTDDDGNIISKTIKPNSNGELVMVEKTKTSLACARSFGEAMLVLEVIQRLASKTSVFLTEDEEEQRYIEMIKAAKSDRERFL